MHYVSVMLMPMLARIKIKAFVGRSVSLDLQCSLGVFASVQGFNSSLTARSFI